MSPLKGYTVLLLPSAWGRGLLGGHPLPARGFCTVTADSADQPGNFRGQVFCKQLEPDRSAMQTCMQSSVVRQQVCTCVQAKRSVLVPLRVRTPSFAIPNCASRTKQWSRISTRAESSDDTPGGDEESEWKLPVAGSNADWREFRARLVAGETKSAEENRHEEGRTSSEPSTSGRDSGLSLWAHPIPRPEKGCLLLAHPLMFNQNQIYFHQAVILLISHDETGTAGLILNKPLEHLIGALSGAEELMPEFNNNRLFLGGDVGSERGNNVMQLLHDQQQLEKSVEVVSGIYLGGFQAAKKAVRRGDLDAAKLRWYCRYAGWAPGQLQSEIDKGVWFTAAASKDMILHPCCLVNGRQHWHTVMQRMGGEFAQLSQALLVEPEIRREVWGKSDYLKSSQGQEQARPDSGNEESI